jgi:hypothetical protein
MAPRNHNCPRLASALPPASEESGDAAPGEAGNSQEGQELRRARLLHVRDRSVGECADWSGCYAGVRGKTRGPASPALDRRSKNSAGSGWDLRGSSRQPTKPSMSPGRSRWWARTAHARHDFDGAPGPTSTKPVMDSKRPSLPTMPKSVPTKWVGASSVPPASHVKRTRSLWASTTLASRKR